MEVKGREEQILTDIAKCWRDYQEHQLYCLQESITVRHT